MNNSILKLEDILLNSNLYIPISLQDISFENIEEYVNCEVFKQSQKFNLFDFDNTPDKKKLKEYKNFIDFIKKPSNTTLDCFCTTCKKDSIFQYKETTTKNESKKDINFLIYKCSRCNEDNLLIIFYFIDDKIIKIGQYPSTYEQIKIKSSQEYRDFLDDYYSEYTSAIITNSLGFSIAGFTYLRRIFEKLMDDVFMNYKEDIKLTDEEFFKIKSMTEKLEYLKEYFPEFLKNNSKNLYEILSIHIHTLTEESAKEYFYLMLDAINHILDERIKHNNSIKTGKILTKNLSHVQKNLSGIKK